MAKVDVFNDLEDFSVELCVDEWDSTITIEHYRGESKKVIVPESFGGIPVTAVGNFAFLGQEKVEHIYLPEGLTSIGDFTFSGCTRLKSVFLPESVTFIGEAAFNDCEQLINVTLPENLVCIDDRVFKNCKQLAKIKIPKNLVKIGDSFAGCDKLTKITVDENNPVYASVDGVLFDKAITTIIAYPAGKKGNYTIPDTVIEINSNAFRDCRNLTRIAFSQGVMRSSINAFSGCERLSSITVDDGNAHFSSIDGVLYDKKGETLLQYPQGSNATKCIVPDGVVCIDDLAFLDCKYLTEIVLPEGLKFIGDNVFCGCEKLTAIVLPVSLLYLGECVFKNCPDLETITLSRNTKMGYKAIEGFSGKLIYRD